MISDQDLDRRLRAADPLDAVDLPELPAGAWAAVTASSLAIRPSTNEHEPASVVAARQLATDARDGHRVRRSRRPRRRVMALAVAGMAAAVAVAVFGVSPGGTTSDAFASWTSTPDDLSPEQSTAAEAACISQVNGTVGVSDDPQFQFAPLDDPSAVLVDRRGAWTYTVLASAPDSAGRQRIGDCLQLSQPSRQGGSSLNDGPVAAAPTAGVIVVLASSHSGASDGDTASTYAGRSAPDVVAVTMILPDGNSADALVNNGWWSVWFPGDTLDLDSSDVIVRTTSADGSEREATLDRLWR